MDKVIIVSPYFPPSNVAGVHRARILGKHLKKAGWEPIIICVAERYHKERLDNSLTRLLPKDLRIHKVAALPLFVGRLLGIGDLGIRGYHWLKAEVIRLIRTEDVKIVLITVLPGFPMLMIKSLKRISGIKVVLDYQDPWVSAWGMRQKMLTKAWLAHRIACLIEPRVIVRADAITSVSAGTNQWLKSLYPSIADKPFYSIPIGIDPDDFTYAEKPERDIVPERMDKTVWRLCYVGNIWPEAQATLEAFLEAVLEVKRDTPALYQRLQIVFVGSSNQPNGVGEYRALPEARKLGVDDCVCETPERIPYLKALGVMKEADALLMIGSAQTHYTPSKLYPVLLSGKKSLAIFHENSSVTGIARRTGGVVIVTFKEDPRNRETRSEIASWLRKMIDGTASVGPVIREDVLPYTAEEIANRFADVFTECVA